MNHEQHTSEPCAPDNAMGVLDLVSQQLDELRGQIAQEWQAVATEREAMRQQRVGLERLPAQLGEAETTIARLNGELQEQRRELEEHITAAAYLRRDKAELEYRLAHSASADELAAVRRELDESAAAAARLQQEKAELEQRLSRSASADELAAVRRELDESAAGAARLQQEKAELEQRLSHSASADELAAVRRELDESAAAAAHLQQEKAELEQRLSHSASADELAAVRRALDEQSATMASVQQENAKLRAEVESAAGSPKIEAMAQELRERARRVAAVVEHLRRRRARLQGVRRAIASQGRSSHLPAQETEERLRAAQMIEHERQLLEETRQTLARSEGAMVRQWARPRAIVMTGWIVFMLISVAAASWVAAGQFFPSMQSASFSIEPSTRAGGVLSPQDLERWAEWHAALPYNDQFITALARRMAERRLEGFATPERLRRQLGQHLSVDAGSPDAVTYTLGGYDSETTLAALDLLASSVLVESNRQMRNRGDGTWAVARNESGERGRVQYAALNPWRLDQRRVYAAGVMFALLTTVTGAVMITFYRRLLRGQRVFDAFAC
jgi:hypothetical protein